MEYKLIIFDMDGTLLKGRKIIKLADTRGFGDRLIDIMKSDIKAHKKTTEIAKLMKCLTVHRFLKIFREIPLQKNAEFVIKELKKKGLIIAIATDSYTLGAMDLKKRLDIDYVFANELITKNSHLTGNIILNNKDLTKKFEKCKIHSICKRDVLRRLCKELNITKNEVITVGDGKVDICMLKEAGLGLAFNAPDEVKKNADESIIDLIEILDYI